MLLGVDPHEKTVSQDLLYEVGRKFPTYRVKFVTAHLESRRIAQLDS